MLCWCPNLVDQSPSFDAPLNVPGVGVPESPSLPGLILIAIVLGLGALLTGRRVAARGA